MQRFWCSMSKSKFNGAAGASAKPSSRVNGRATHNAAHPGDVPIKMTRSSDLPIVPLSREEAVRQAVETVIQAAPAIARAVTEQAKQGNYLPAKFLFDFVGITGMPAAPSEDQSLATLLLSRLGLLPENNATRLPQPSASPAAPDEQSPAANGAALAG
jgi:hypothetical protein